MSTTKDYAFASGGILWKVLDRSSFEAKSIRQQLMLVIVLILLCWMPIAVLSLLKLGWNSFYLLFLRDMVTHVRFLIVLPILLFARRSFNKSFNSTIGFFHQTKIVDDDNVKEFERVLRRVEKWRNSKIVYFIIIFTVYSSFYLQENNRITCLSFMHPGIWWITGSTPPAGGAWS